MAGIRIKLKRPNIEKFVKRMNDRLLKLNRRAVPVAEAVTRELLAMIGKVFADAGRGKYPNTWQSTEMSPMTLFLRRNRVSPRPGKGKRDPKLLSDTGLLRNANIPFIRKRGGEFGVHNLTRYASTHQFGGTSQNQIVTVKNPRARRGRRKDGKPFKRTYDIRTGSHRVPKRPFYPRKRDYLPRIKKLYQKYVANAMRGGNA